MQHVGVGEHILGVVTGPGASFGVGVAIVGGDAQLAQTQLRDLVELIVCQGLGWGEIEHGGSALPFWAARLLDRLKSGHQIAQ